MNWQVILSSQAVQDMHRLSHSGIELQASKLLTLLEKDPLAVEPRFEKLVGNLVGFYSRRIHIMHRLVYRLDQGNKVVHVLRMWSHCELE